MELWINSEHMLAYALWMLDSIKKTQLNVKLLIVQPRWSAVLGPSCTLAFLCYFPGALCHQVISRCKVDYSKVLEWYLMNVDASWLASNFTMCSKLVQGNKNKLSKLWVTCHVCWEFTGFPIWKSVNAENITLSLFSHDLTYNCPRSCIPAELTLLSNIEILHEIRIDTNMVLKKCCTQRNILSMWHQYLNIIISINNMPIWMQMRT